MNALIEALKALVQSLSEYLVSLRTPKIPQNLPPSATLPPKPKTFIVNATKPPMPPTNPDALLPWTTTENCRHNVRAIADLAGMTPQQKDDFSRTMHCESGYSNSTIMLNCEHAFVRQAAYNPTVHGAILSKDLGVFQINSYWHITHFKDFPSEEYVLQNPTIVGQWAAKIFKVAPQTWNCYKNGICRNYTP